MTTKDGALEPMQRQMIDILRGDDVREEPFARERLLHGLRRRGRFDDALVAVLTRVFRADGFDHHKPRRLVVQFLRDVLADPQPRVAARALLLGLRDVDLDASTRQMRGQRPSARRLPAAVAAHRRLARIHLHRLGDRASLVGELQGIFAREGIDLPRSTMCGWVADVATALSPIGEQLRREITAVDYLQTDDTTITVLGDDGGSFKGRIWTYLDPLARQVVFDATTTHERDGPAAVLADFRGKLQADAYSGYDGLYQSGRVVEVGCWAHGRRRFVEAFMTDASAALMFALIQQFYQVQRDAADLDPAVRLALRQELSVPLLAKIDTERQALARTVLPKSPVGEAVRYLTNQWTALQRFAEDGRLAIDNNRAENQLRLVAVGRKDWLFAGSFEGARRAALLYSLVQSCKLINAPPFEYLKDILRRLPTHPHRLIDQLTPRGWAKTVGPAA